VSWLIAAYAAVLVAVVLYVVRLQRLRREVDREAKAVESPR
jgi:CcmD family protein